MRTLPTVTDKNYFSTEIQMAYMSASQYKAFSACEAAALAECKGEYVRETTTALLVGSYVDAHFEGTLDVFKAKHPELFKRDGGLKSEYVKAEEIINRLEQDELFMLLMSGKKQVIQTGEISGIPFRIKIDSLLDESIVKEIINRFPDTATIFGFGDGAIVDGKIMRDMAPVWDETEHRKLPFVEAWGYDIQGAIYQAIERHMLPFVLAVGTKEPVTDLAAISICDDDLSAKLAEIEDTVPRYQAIKEGKIQPSQCGRCEYCRSKKKLTKIVDYKELCTW